MRKVDEISQADIDNLYVTCTTDAPRSERNVPLRVVMGGLSQNPDVPVPSVPDHGTQSAIQALSDDLARARAEITRLSDRPAPIVDLSPILARLEALEQRPAPVAAQPPSDMPAFLQRAAAAARSSPVAEQPVPATADIAIDAVHEIERHVLDLLQRLADRLDIIERQLAIPTAAQPDPASGEAVQRLTDWLRILDARISEADAHARAAEEAVQRQMAAGSIATPPEPKRPPATLAEAKAEALDRVKAAARARRDLLIGGTVDERDMLARLWNRAMDARVGNRADAIDQMEILAGALGEDWPEVAKRYIGRSDKATEVIVATLALEIRAARFIHRPDVLTSEAIEREVVDVVGAINKVGE